MELPIPIAPLLLPSPLPTSSTPSLAPNPRLVLTKEEKQAARKAEKAAQLAAQVVAEGKGAANGGTGSGNGAAGGARFLAREWGDVVLGPGEEETAQGGGRKVMVMSWNMLAQALVRRDLFPGSDFLKVKDRIPSLMQEVLHYAPDIVCLQEVDRLEDHLPSLTLTHSYTSFIGYPDKSHGLLIAHKSNVFSKVGELGIKLDDLPLFYPSSSPSTSDPPTHSRKSIGLSRKTRNVALFVALAFNEDKSKGMIVGTTHLFWHPQHVYERARQTGIMLREAKAFRDAGEGWGDWPVVLAGDFNTQPIELPYALLHSLPPTPRQISGLQHSSVIHATVDKLHDPDYFNPTYTRSTPGAIKIITDKAAEDEGVKEGNAKETDPDKVIRNARPAELDDGLASLGDLQRLYEGEAVRSAYGTSAGMVEGMEGEYYSARLPEVQDGTAEVVVEHQGDVEARAVGTYEERVKRGDFEPIYTNFTPLWRCTLDYIFILPPRQDSKTPVPRVHSLLHMHDIPSMGIGLPKKGVCGSDHVAIGAVLDVRN